MGFPKHSRNYSQWGSDPCRQLFQEPLLQAEDHSSGIDESRFVSDLIFPPEAPSSGIRVPESGWLPGNLEPHAAAQLAKTYLQAWQQPPAAKQRGEQLSFP